MNHAGRFAFLLLMSLVLAGCSAHETQTAERSVSPLIGTWMRDGDPPKPDPNAPEFTRLTFAPDGSLSARYVEAGGALAGIIAKAPKLKSEKDTYATPDGSTLRIAEGTSNLRFSYRVDGAKLYLTPPGGSSAAVFTKAAGS
jgi:hypothetical protein